MATENIENDENELLTYSGWRIEEYIDRCSGTPTHRTREVQDLNIQETLENVVERVKQPQSQLKHIIKVMDQLLPQLQEKSRFNKNQLFID